MVLTDLIPWTLIHFDEAMLSLVSQGKNYHLLENHGNDFNKWFNFYIDNETIEFQDKNEEVLQSSLRYPRHSLLLKAAASATVMSLNHSSKRKSHSVSHKIVVKEERAINFNLLSKFAYDFGIVPKIIKFSELSRFT